MLSRSGGDAGSGGALGPATVGPLGERADEYVALLSSDAVYRLLFDVGQQYTELVFRQFLVQLAAPTAPFTAPLLGALGAAVTYATCLHKLRRRAVHASERVKNAFGAA